MHARLSRRWIGGAAAPSGAAPLEAAMDDRTDRQDAKARLVAAMDAGCRWDEAAATAGILVSRSTAYRLSLRAGREGPSAFVDGRHGHASKLRDPLPAWIAASCHAQPHASSQHLQQGLG